MALSFLFWNLYNFFKIKIYTKCILEEMRELIMRKLIKILGSILIVCGLVFFGAKFITKNNTGAVAYSLDMANPFTTSEEVFGQVNSKYNKTWKDAANGNQNYGYDIKTSSANGSERTVQIVSFGKELNVNGQFIKVFIKGQYVKKYHEISKNEVPSDIIKKIEVMK